jgi:hypothetical protein
MTQSGTLLTVIVVAALILPPSASLAQQRQQLPPGGPIFPSGRVLRGPDGLPNLTIPSVAAGKFTCVGPSIAQVTMSVSVKNNGNGAAVMPPTMPALGRYWVGVWDLNTSPGVMMIAAGQPSQLLPNEAKLFAINVVVRTGVGPSGSGFGVGARVDPGNLIFESSENDNDHPAIFTSKTLCQ